MADTNNPFTAIDNRLSSIESKLDALYSREQPKSEKKFYPVNEAAEKLGVAEITLYRECKKGNIPSKKIGERVVIPGSYVDGN